MDPRAQTTAHPGPAPQSARFQALPLLTHSPASHLRINKHKLGIMLGMACQLLMISLHVVMRYTEASTSALTCKSSSNVRLC